MAIPRVVAIAFKGVFAAASVGLFSIGAAADNLTEFGVPSVERLTPYRTRFLDKTDKIPGRESRIDFYKAEGKLVVLYSIRGKPNSTYAVAVDNDFKVPIDQVYIDYNGKGAFEPISGSNRFTAPDWVIKQR